MALFSRVKVWNAGEVLYASDLNSEFNNLLSGFTPIKIEGASATVSAMQQTQDPGELGSEAPAGNLLEEIKQIRFAVKEMKGTAQWYQSAVGNLSTGVSSSSVDNSTVEINANILRVKDGGISNAKVADGAVYGAKIPAAAITGGSGGHVGGKTLNYLNVSDEGLRISNMKLGLAYSADINTSLSVQSADTLIMSLPVTIYGDSSAAVINNKLLVGVESLGSFPNHGRFHVLNNSGSTKSLYGYFKIKVMNAAETLTYAERTYVFAKNPVANNEEFELSPSFIGGDIPQLSSLTSEALHVNLYYFLHGSSMTVSDGALGLEKVRLYARQF